ncbi:MAG TPA: molybdopterin cofactor-binding domain-containing protein, partial [Polyangiaceae bacterium]
MSSVGQGIDRVDARLKVTGKAVYAGEVPVGNVAYGVIVGSRIAKGRVTALDTGAAAKAPGVLAVLTHLNAPKLPSARKKAGFADRVLQLLQDDQVLYADQPIALIVADSLERAQHAAALVVAQYDEATPDADVETSRSSPFEPAATGPVGKPDTQRGGDIDEALAGAKAKVEVTYRTPVQNHNPMEPHATIAVWQGADRLTLYDATQGIFGVRKRIATIFDLPPENVRVVNHYVGGGFGCKGSPWSHVALAVMAAKVVGRPVKLAVTRPQMFALVGHRPKTVQRLSLGADANGKLVAMKHDVVNETSSFDEFTEPSAVQTTMLY